MTARPLFVDSLRLLALPVAAALLLGACAGAGQTGSGSTGASPAPSPAVGRQIPVLTPTEQPAGLGAVERFAWQQVVHLGDAFAAGDVDGFLAKVSRGFYRGYGALETSLRALMADSRARAAVVAIRLVSQDEGRISVRAAWTRSVTLPDGTVDARHGETVFLFLVSDTNLRLLDYRGDAPFGIEGI